MSLWCEGDGAECAECHAFDFLPSMCPACKRLFCWEHIFSHHLVESKPAQVVPPPWGPHALDKTTSPSTSLIGEVSPCVGGPSPGEAGEERRAWCTLGRDEEGQNRVGSGHAPLENRNESGGGGGSIHVTPSSRTGASVFSTCTNDFKRDPSSPSLVEPSPSPGPLSSSTSLKKPPSIQDTPHMYSCSRKDKVPFVGGMRMEHSHWVHVASSTLHCPLRLETGPSHHFSSTRVAIPIILSGCIAEVFKVAHHIPPQSSPQGPGEDHRGAILTEGDAKQKEREDRHHKVEEESMDSPASEGCCCDAAQGKRFTFSICSWDVATYFSLGRAIESCLEMYWLDAENLSGKFYFATVRDSTTLDEEENIPRCSSSSSGWNGCSDDCDHSRLDKGEEEELLKTDAKSAEGEEEKEKKQVDPYDDVSGFTDSQNQTRLEITPTDTKKRFITEREKELAMKRNDYPMLQLVPLSNSLLIQDVMKMRSSESASSPPRCSFLLLHVTAKKTSSSSPSVEENYTGHRKMGESSSIAPPVFQYDLSQELSQALFDSKYEKGASSTPQNTVKTYPTSATAVGKSSAGNGDSIPVNSFLSTEHDMASYVWPSIRCFRDDPRVKAIRTRLLIQYKAEKEIMKAKKKKMEIVRGGPHVLSLGGGDGGNAVRHESEPPCEENSAPSPLPLPNTTSAHQDTVLPPSLLNSSSPPPPLTTYSSDTTGSTDVYWPFVKPSPVHSFSFHNTKVQPIRCEGLMGKESGGSPTVRVAVFIEDAVLGISSSIPPVHVVLNPTWMNAKAGQLLKETLQLYIKRVCSVPLSPNDERLRLIQSKYELFAFLRGKQKQPLRPRNGEAGRERKEEEDIAIQFPCLSALPWRSQPLLLQNGDCLFFGLPDGCSRERCFQDMKDGETIKMVSSSSATTNCNDPRDKNSQLFTPQVPRALVNEVKRMEQYTTRAEKQQLQKDLLTKCFVM